MEKAMAPRSSTLAWIILWTEEPGGLQSMGSLSRTGLSELHFHFSLLCTGEGNGNPLQCSCLENPRDGGAWWAATYGVAQSRTRLKRQYQAACKPTDLSEASLQGVVVIQVNQLVISVHLSEKTPRQVMLLHLVLFSR